MLDRVGDRGAALAVLRGPDRPKSSLLSQLGRMASERGMCVLRPAAVGDARCFAGLRTLLEPALGRLDALPRSESDTLRVALKLAPGVPPEPFRVAFAVLSLLGAVAVDEPVALIADDVHRLDRYTADVLCLVARWLRPTDAVVVFLAGRAGRSAVLTGAGVDRLKLGTFDARWPGGDAPPPTRGHEHAHQHRHACRRRATRPFPSRG